MATTLNRSPDATYVVYGEPRFETTPTTWTDLPNAKVPLSLGQGSASYGAIFIATFSAEVLASAPDNNGVVSATVFFGSEQAKPVSDNHRFATARGNPEWSSRTFIRTIRFDPDISARDVTAKVRLGGSTGVTAGIQNWVLKIERFNL